MTTEPTPADVLALVDDQATAVAGEEAPVPPVGASPRATAVWYQTLADHDLETVAEWRLLESVVEVISTYDRVKADWEADGAPMTAVGSMGQPTEDNRLGTMQKLRAQEAALWKQIALPRSDDAATGRRPGRPTRAEGGGAWGTGVR